MVEISRKSLDFIIETGELVNIEIIATIFGNNQLFTFVFQKIVAIISIFTNSPVSIMKSNDFLDISTKLYPNQWLYGLIGRLLLVQSIVFPVLNYPKTNMKYINTTNDPQMDLFFSIASKECPEFHLKSMINQLNNLKVNSYASNLEYLPPPSFSCVESIISQEIEADIALMISIQGLIHMNQSEEFKKLVIDFASKCKIDGEHIVRLIQKYDSEYMFSSDISDSKPGSEDNLTDIIENLPQPVLFEPFSLPEKEETEFMKPNHKDYESALSEINTFAGNDKNVWFENGEFNTWRTSRICIFHLLDHLDDKTFKVIS